MKNLTCFAGASGGPFIFLITVDPNFGQLDLTTCTLTLRISQDSISKLDLTGASVVLTGAAIAVRISKTQTATLGAGIFDYFLLIETAGGLLITPTGAGQGRLTLTGPIPT